MTYSTIIADLFGGGRGVELVGRAVEEVRVVDVLASVDDHVALRLLHRRVTVQIYNSNTG